MLSVWVNASKLIVHNQCPVVVARMSETEVHRTMHGNGPGRRERRARERRAALYHRLSELAVRMKLYKYKHNRKYMHRKLQGASKSSGLGSPQIFNMPIIYYIKEISTPLVRQLRRRAAICGSTLGKPESSPSYLGSPNRTLLSRAMEPISLPTNRDWITSAKS